MGTFRAIGPGSAPPHRTPTGAVRVRATGIALAGTMLLAACGAPRAAPAAPTGPAPAGFPVTIQNCGRTLTFDRPPSRVYLGFQTMSEIAVGLGQGDRAIAQIKPVVLPLPEQAAAFERIPDVSQDSYTPVGREQMFALRPDLQVAFFDFEFGGTDRSSTPGLATIEEMATIGAQVYSALCRNAQNENVEDIESAYRAIGDLGAIFGVPDRAAARIAAMKQQIADVQTKVAGREPVRVLYYNGGEGPIGTVGGDSFINELIELAGGVNVFGDTTEGKAEGYFMAPLERVSTTDAAVYLINTQQEPDSPDAAANAAYLYRTFPGLPASRDRRVVVTDYIAAAAGWRFPQVVEDLARVLHPEAFA